MLCNVYMQTRVHVAPVTHTLVCMYIEAKVLKTNHFLQPQGGWKLKTKATWWGGSWVDHNWGARERILPPPMQTSN